MNNKLQLQTFMTEYAARTGEMPSGIPFGIIVDREYFIPLTAPFVIYLASTVRALTRVRSIMVPIIPGLEQQTTTALINVSVDMLVVKLSDSAKEVAERIVYNEQYVYCVVQNSEEYHVVHGKAARELANNVTLESVGNMSFTEDCIYMQYTAQDGKFRKFELPLAALLLQLEEEVDPKFPAGYEEMANATTVVETFNQLALSEFFLEDVSLVDKLPNEGPILEATKKFTETVNHPAMRGIVVTTLPSMTGDPVHCLMALHEHPTKDASMMKMVLLGRLFDLTYPAEMVLPATILANKQDTSKVVLGNLPEDEDEAEAALQALLDNMSDEMKS